MRVNSLEIEVFELSPAVAVTMGRRDYGDEEEGPEEEEFEEEDPEEGDEEDEPEEMLGDHRRPSIMMTPCVNDRIK
jgi:hypothetical protein